MLAAAAAQIPRVRDRFTMTGRHVPGQQVTASDFALSMYFWPNCRPGRLYPYPLGASLADACPDTVDAVFRKILRRRGFTWAEHGEALMRRRKEWYYRREPRPGVSVIGDRLLELAFGGRR